MPLISPQDPTITPGLPPLSSIATPPAGAPALGSGNPILDEIDNAHAALSPPAKQAIEDTHGIVGLRPADTAQATESAAPAPMPTSPAAPGLPPVGQSPLGPALSLGGQRPSTPATNELHRLQTTGSGISQIHNPFARVPLQILDALGRGFFPGVEMGIPGTSGHHDVLLAQQGKAVNQEEGERAADTADENAASKRSLEGAQANEANAKAGESKEDQPHTLATDQGIMQWNPDTKRFDIPAGKPPEKEETEGKTVTTDQGVMQWDPKTKAYSIKVGNAPEKESQGKTLQDADGVWYSIGKDNAAVPITVGGKPFQGKTPEEKTGSPEQQFIDEYRNKNKGASVADAEKAFKAIQPPEKANEGTWSLQQNAKGETVLFNTKTGQTQAAPADIVKNGPTAQTRTMQETAPKVLDLAARVGQLVDQQAKTLGPAASRWSEFMAGKVGAPNPEFTKLRTDVGLLQTALMRMHVGSRGGEQMMQHFQGLIDVAKQSPENLKAALGEITAYANAVKGAGHESEGVPTGGGPAPGTVEGGYKFKGGDPKDQKNWERVGK